VFFAFGGAEPPRSWGDKLTRTPSDHSVGLFFSGVTVAFCYIIGTGPSCCFALRLGGNNRPGADASRRQDCRTHWLWRRDPIRSLLRCSAGRWLLRVLHRRSVAPYPFVAGLDRFLPPIFEALHRRGKTSLDGAAGAGIIGASFSFLGQPGPPSRAYAVMAAMTDHLFSSLPFSSAAMFQVANQPVGPEVIRVPEENQSEADRVIGFSTTTLTIILSSVPQPADPNKPLAV